MLVGTSRCTHLFAFLSRESPTRGQVGWLSTEWVGGEGGGFKICERWGVRDNVQYPHFGTAPPTHIMTLGTGA